jgi:homoserine kinase type II
LLKRINAIEAKQSTDRYMVTRLASRKAWLENRPPFERVSTGTESTIPIHGDYQNTNVFFDGGTISALIDWDKIYRAPAA